MSVPVTLQGPFGSGPRARRGSTPAFARAPRRPSASEAASDAEERIAFLATAGELLSSSLEWRTVLQRLSELAVPVLADWCVVDVLADDGAGGARGRGAPGAGEGGAGP